ncbi:ABC transporter ATP-binding protein [Microvirga pakistanensis]|uniref:ABC transporter ATP-binding protein n=1 Tax=Microvirga pakistanensis TaxID=1682650 RepID=UPI00106B7FB1|nr:ABC transporter ATP-binding protein [Microvirga pakistanensis]
MTALLVENLAHEFGKRRALNEVSFSVEPGTFCVLLGPNGAGKTTLISLVTGLYAARQGEIRILGQRLRTDPLRALAQLGVVFQASTLDLDLTVSENLLYFGSLHGFSRREARERSAIELERLNVADRMNDKVRNLSGGLRRRVEIARALIHRPRLLIVDEATVGLDVIARQSLLHHVRSLCRDQGLSVLWATHLLDEVEADDGLVVLHQGRVCWRGRAGDLSRTAAGLEDAFLKLTGQAG